MDLSDALFGPIRRLDDGSLDTPQTCRFVRQFPCHGSCIRRICRRKPGDFEAGCDMFGRLAERLRRAVTPRGRAARRKRQRTGS